MVLPGVPMALADRQGWHSAQHHAAAEDTVPRASLQPALGQDSAPTLLGTGGRHPVLPAKPSCCLPFLQELGEETAGVQGSGNIPSVSSAPKPCHLSRQLFVQAHWEQLGLLSQTAGCRSAEGMNAPAYGTHLLPLQGEVATRTQAVAQQHRQKQCPGTHASASLGRGWALPSPSKELPNGREGLGMPRPHVGLGVAWLAQQW